MKVYPNPVRNKLFIESSKKNQTQALEYRLYSLTGQIIKVGSSNSVESNLEIDLDGFPTGVYYLRVIQGTELTTHKVLKIN